MTEKQLTGIDCLLGLSRPLADNYNGSKILGEGDTAKAALDRYIRIHEVIRDELIQDEELTSPISIIVHSRLCSAYVRRARLSGTQVSPPEAVAIAEKMIDLDIPQGQISFALPSGKVSLELPASVDCAKDYFIAVYDSGIVFGQPD